MKIYLLAAICILFFMTPGKTTAQANVNQISLRDSIEQQTKPREKLYLHFDKPDYIIGDTIWFAVYLHDALTQKPSEKSGIAYVELFDENNVLVERIALRTIGGTTFGQFITDNSFTEGTYHLRAYTNWMQNFGDTLFFQKDIPLAGGSQNWLMQMSQPKIYNSAGNDSVQLSFVLKDVTGQLLKYKDVGIAIQNKKGKNLITSQISTDVHGSADINFNLPQKIVEDNVWICLQDIDNKQKITKISTPLQLHEDNTIDIQFLPESGHLVAGLPNKVAFKALDTQGKPVDVTGNIKNSAGDIVASFSSIHNGMGFFALMPQSGEQYSANVAYGKGLSQQTPLPAVETSGTLISVNPNNGENIMLDLLSTPDLLNQKYYVLARSKGKVFWGVDFSFTQNDIHTGILKSVFPTGVCSFQLYKADGELVNERAFFVNNKDNLHISFHLSDQNNYTADSIPLEVSVTNSLGQPVQGSFSLAVTDDQRVHKDFNKDENILSYMLLGSDLRGHIDAPGYYFSDSSFEVVQALDALMLTQGYVKYDWQKTKMTFLPEPAFQISGKVINGLNKPVKGGKVTVVSLDNKRFIAKDTTTNNDGTFVVNHFPNFDSASFAVQIQNKRGGSYGFGITLNKFTHASMPAYERSRLQPVNVNLDTTTENALVARNDYLAAQKKADNGLEDVIVYSKAAIHDSKNLNGPGGYDTALTTQQLLAMGDTTLFDVIWKKLPQINIQKDITGSLSGTYHGTKLIIIIDGVRATAAPDKARFQPAGAGTSLDGYLASDIKGIELMEPGPLTNKYDAKFLSHEEQVAKASGTEYSYLEITSYAGYGPFIKKEPGMEVLRPQPFTYGRFFYMPRYVNFENTESNLPDARSTIFWFPQVLTDKDGKAGLYFYSAGQPSTYTLWLEGTDLNGSFGAASKKVNIEAHP